MRQGAQQQEEADGAPKEGAHGDGGEGDGGEEDGLPAPVPQVPQGAEER